MELGDILGWLVIGLLAGWLAGQITRGKGFGCIVNILIGIVGAVLGGLLFETATVSGPSGFIGSLATATLGALILLVIAGLARR